MIEDMSSVKKFSPKSGVLKDKTMYEDYRIAVVYYYPCVRSTAAHEIHDYHRDLTT